MHRRHPPARLLHNQLLDGAEEFSARNEFAPVLLEDVARREQIAKRSRKEAVAVPLERLLVRGHRCDGLDDGGLAHAFEHHLRRARARVAEKDAAGVTEIQMGDVVPDADALEEIPQIGQLEPGREFPEGRRGSRETRVANARRTRRGQNRKDRRTRCRRRASGLGRHALQTRCTDGRRGC